MELLLYKQNSCLSMLCVYEAVWEHNAGSVVVCTGSAQLSSALLSSAQLCSACVQLCVSHTRRTEQMHFYFNQSSCLQCMHAARHTASPPRHCLHAATAPSPLDASCEAPRLCGGDVLTRTRLGA